MYPRSDHYDGRLFHNTSPVTVTPKGAAYKMLREYLKKHPGKEPLTKPGPFHTDPEALALAPANDIQVTWIGHATLLLQVEGVTLLTDPVWYKRVSPFSQLGPTRFFDAPISLGGLPPIDAVLLSHDHYDHLDRKTVLQLLRLGIPVITMLGVGKRLLRWGADPKLVTELDWWQVTKVKALEITAAPAQHFSGRTLTDRFSTLWGSFAIRSNQNNIYFGADSGYQKAFATIGDQLGPFDLTLLDSGAYNELWADIHMGPENAVQAHLDLKGKLLMPIHWGTFSLAFHPWKEPVERVIAAASDKGVNLLLPAPGQSRCVGDGPYNSQWWEQFS